MSQGSPCIDAGSNEFVYFKTDFDNNVRIWNATNINMAIVDIGAFEYDSPYYDGPTSTEKEMYERDNYLIYPNPFTEHVTIQWSDAAQPLKIELVDMLGRCVRILDNLSDNHITIYRENLSSGLYFLRIHSDDTYVKKVIIK